LFLPNSLRSKLGLRSNDERFARDLFLFASIVNSRRAGGTAKIIVGRQDYDGKPLKPSRILFMCPDDELVARVGKLFKENKMRPAVEPPNSGPAWRLLPEWKPGIIGKLSVTSFRDYLACPFRFYLGHVSGLSEIEYEKFELDAMEFGTICHEALRALYGCEEKDSAEISKLLENTAAHVLRRKYGDDLSLPVVIQEYSLMQRLRKAAEVEAEQRKEGWRSVAVEYRLGDGKGIELDGMLIRGTIDRIDYNPLLRKVRILDYKTSEKEKKPETEHRGRNGWYDLQLPLYRILFERDDAIKARIPGDFDSISCGYFNLPKAVSSTGISEWKDIDKEIKEAEKIALNVISSIRNNIFWPPAQKVGYELSDWLFPYDVTDCIDGKFGGRDVK